MGLPAINSLANMELMLYGGKAGLNSACPSFLNGYTGNSALYNNMMGMYYSPYNFGFNPTFRGGNSIYDTYTPSYGQPQAGNTNFQGITQEDMNKLADYYANNNVLEEGFAGAATGGLSWMAFEHAQSIFHPKNAWKGIKESKEIFKDIPEAFAKENAALLQDAQIAVQQTVRDTGKKGWWSAWLRRSLNDPTRPEVAKANMEEINKLLDKMKTAVKNRDVKAIAELTETLQATRGMDGKIIGALTGRKTVAERLAKKSKDIPKNSKQLLDINNAITKNKLGPIIKHCFKKEFLVFMAFEALFNLGKISTAFEKDTSTGLKQTGQSIGKSALGVAGWCLGRAGGALLGAKAGAALGIAGGPAGAAIGALIGFTVGSIGMWLGHKLGNKVFGKDVADKVEAKNMTKTEAGQAQLLQFAMQKAQEGKTDAQTNQVLGKLLNAYA